MTHAIDFVHMADKIIIMEKGRIVGSGTYDELKDNETLVKLVNVNNINNQSPANKIEKSNDDSTSSGNGSVKNAHIQSLVTNSTNNKSTFVNDMSESEKLEYFKKIGRVTKDNDGKIVKNEDDEVVYVGLGTYWRYLKLSKRTFVFFTILIFVFGEYLSSLVANNMIGEWSNDAENQQKHFKYYASITCGAFVAFAVNIAIYHSLRYYLSLKISRNMHKKMMETVLKAPINLFFDVTPSGTVINRFSNDIDVVDNQISGTMVGVLSLSFNVVATVIQMAYSNYRLLALVPILVIATFALYRYQNKAFKECQRIESTQKSPLLNFLGETITGNSTIRAFRRENEYIEKNFELLNRNFLSNQLAACMWNWQCVRLDLLTCLVSTISLLVVMKFKDEEANAKVAVLFQYLLGFQGA